MCSWKRSGPSATNEKHFNFLSKRAIKCLGSDASGGEALCKQITIRAESCERMHVYLCAASNTNILVLSSPRAMAAEDGPIGHTLSSLGRRQTNFNARHALHHQINHLLYTESTGGKKGPVSHGISRRSSAVDIAGYGCCFLLAVALGARF
jgi:hypothetical protein